MNKRLIESIASYGNKYQERHLSEYNPDLLLKNWWEALDFFFSRACYQGRRDALSKRVYDAVTEVLKPEFGVTTRTANYQRLCQQEWKLVEQELRQRIGKGKVGKARDIDMVLSTLDFIGHISDLNIVRYSVEQITLGNIDEHYADLQSSRSSNGITQVGPKIAAFYLRDLVSLYHLEGKVPPASAFCLQPVDVWVEKLARELDIVDDDANQHHIQTAIIALCQKYEISPLLFNQGAWYVGYYAFEIVLEILMKQGD
ncbi:MAG: hypothetical protein WBD79_02290 [Anaerolineae bacterium]